MKLKITFIILLLISTLAYTQKSIHASAILKRIAQGKDVVIENTIIKGELDLTFMNTKLKHLAKRDKWWKKGGRKNVITTINNMIIFINCTFKNKVLTYNIDDENGYSFESNFVNPINFKDCTFKDMALFKNSKFKKDFNITGSKFIKDVSLKNCSFEKNVSFENTIFNDPVTFKSTKFKGFANFKNSIFKETAIYKHCKFLNGISLENARFEEDLNLKYAKILGSLNLNNLEVIHDIETKYAKHNNEELYIKVN